MRRYFHSPLLQPGAEPRAYSAADAPPFFLVQLSVHGGLPCISTCADLLQRFIVSCCYMALQHVSWSSAVATWRLAMCFYVSWFVATLFFQVSYCDIAFQHVTNSADAPPCCFLKFSCLKKAGDSAVLCQLKLCWSSVVATWFLTTCFYFSWWCYGWYNDIQLLVNMFCLH